MKDVRNCVVYWYKWKSGFSLQPYFSSGLLLLGNAESSFISSIVRASSVMSFSDHFCLISCLSAEGHLHHIQAYIKFKDI